MRPQILFVLMVGAVVWLIGHTITPRPVADRATPPAAKPARRQVIVTATSYAKGDCCEWRDGSVVYAGGPPWVGTIAVSRDLWRLLPMGTRVRILGWSYVVRDLMGPTVHGRRIDIYAPSVSYALRWGIRRVTLEVL